MRSILVLVAGCLLFFSSMVWAAAPARPAAVSLGRGEMVNDENEPGGPLLIREIIRQGFLIAARDGLALPTRDEVLGEPLGPDALQPSLKGTHPIHVELRRAGASEPIWNGDIDVRVHSDDLTTLVTAVAKLSQGEFVEALKRAGWGAANHVANGGSDGGAAVA